jgi:peptidoglycan/LPS O-acetylase OafA/YrhL
MPPAETSRRYWSLDVLRGVCALIIFISHWILWARFDRQGAIESTVYRGLHALTDGFAWLFWPKGGNHAAVICFFVLSGFCIHIAFARDADAGRRDVHWGNFYWRRFLRIMPVYWTASLLGLVFVSFELRHPSGNPLLMLHSESSPFTAFIRLIGATDLYPDEILAGNGPLNTVGVELLMYVAYPFFYAQAARGRWKMLGLVFLGLEGIGLLLLPVLSPFWVYNSVLMFGLFWFAGAWLAHCVTTVGTCSCWLPLLLTWCAFIILNTVPHFYGFGVLRQNTFGLACVFGIMQLLHWERTRSAATLPLPLRVLRYIGRISYSLYAVHTPVLLLTTAVLLHIGVTRYSVQLAATMTCALTVIFVTYYAIERVFHQPRTTKPKVAAPVVTTVDQATA